MRYRTPGVYRESGVGDGEEEYAKGGTRTLLFRPMNISVRWLNEYLEPGNVTSEEAQHVLTHVGFPIESVTPVDGGDVCLDVEVTSNRGDVLSHIGCAREIAAATGRRLKLPATNKVFDWSGETPTPAGTIGGSSTDVGGVVSVENRVHDACPMFTARVIRGVKVGQSPKWLVDALAAVGQRSINNVVDVTNFVAFEYGQPTHVFDLATLQPTPDGKARVVVRGASKGETLALLDGKEIKLSGDETVVGDDGVHGPRAISLAGVMGGKLTEVSERSVDVLLEAATWEPVAVRRAARRFQIRTDASYRFERIVDARTIEAAARRAAGLIVRLAGGKLLPGVVQGGTEFKPLTKVRLRTARCASMLGVDVPAPKIQQMLESLEVGVTPEESGDGNVLECTVPAHRPDLEREIDMIEEVARVQGLDKLPVFEKLGVRVASPQASELAVRELGRVLTGLGFFETITFTFVSREQGKAFLPTGLKALEVCDGRRSADPVVRPSALASLLACRRANQDAGNAVAPGSEQELGVRLFEISSSIAEKPAPSSKKGERGEPRGELVERQTLALLADACFPAGAKAIEQKQNAVRLLRGAIEACVLAMGGAETRVDVRPLAQAPVPGVDNAACAEVYVIGKAGEQKLGTFGLVSQSVLSTSGVQTPAACAELSMDVLVGLYPPKSLAHALPAFPSIERDLSLIVAENVAWSRIETLVTGSKPALLEGVKFIGTYRGQQAGAGKKSVTLRLTFRDQRRTLTHDEVTPQVVGVIGLAKKELGAEVRVG